MSNWLSNIKVKLGSRRNKRERKRVRVEVLVQKKRRRGFQPLINDSIEKRVVIAG